MLLGNEGSDRRYDLPLSVFHYVIQFPVNITQIILSLSELKLALSSMPARQMGGVECR